ncbi:MAG: hypothetical protein N2320_02595 [Candidatus Bipolaricaulota bacterium]|nr:hypothetical protein [Candidatus Bipolaricaulota bacterium]
MSGLEELRAYWDAQTEREASRDLRDPRKRVHTDLLWRFLRRCLSPSPARVLDAGAGGLAAVARRVDEAVAPGYG